MKKSICFLFIVLLTLCTAELSVSAEAVRTEGENYSGVSFSGGYKRNGSDFSGGKAFYSDIDASGNDCCITYNVAADKEGIYNMTGVTSLFNAYYTTDFYIRINDGDLYTPRAKVLEKYSWTIAGRSDYMALQDFGNVNLKAGDNKVEIILRKDDPHITDAKFITIIDYFDFTPTVVDFKIREIKAQTDAANVFLKDNKVEFEINFTDAAPEKKIISFDMYDMTGKNVRKGSFTVAKGSDSYRLKLGAMFCGWYKLKFSGVETENILNPIFFSVVSSADNGQEDTPFCIDKYKSTLSDSEKLYKTAGYVGMDMIRVGNDPYLAINHENYLETHEDLYRDAEYAEGMKSLV